MLEDARESFRALELAADVLRGPVLAADAGYCNEANARYLFETGVDGYLADTLFRKRDPRFASAARHKPAPQPNPDRPFQPEDFHVAEDHSFCLCPAGKRLYRNGAHVVINGYAGIKFQGAQRDCVPCALRSRCLKHPERTLTRQFVFFQARAPGKSETYSAKMKRKIDTEQGRYQYGRRLGTVEPVFANLCSAHRLKRFGPARQAQGQHAMAALLPGAQHRQGAALQQVRQGKTMKASASTRRGATLRANHK